MGVLVDVNVVVSVFLRNLTTRLHLSFLPRLRKTMQTSRFVDDRQPLYSN